MKDLLAELLSKYHDRKSNCAIKEPKAISIIEKYAARIQGDDLNINRLMILKCLILSGDDMPCDYSNAEGFQKAYRSWGVIHTRSFGSYDTIMWNLMHMDDLIWEVLKEEGIE